MSEDGVVVNNASITKINKDDYDLAVQNTNKLGSTVRGLVEKEKRSNRKLDGFRRLVQIACVIAVVVLILGLFFSHPVMEHPNTKPTIAVIISVCIMYGVALEIVRGSFAALIVLLLCGGFSSGLSIGYAIAAFRYGMSL